MSFSCHGHRGGGRGEDLQGTVGFEKDWQEGPAKARLVIPYSGEDHSFLCFLAAQVFPCLPRPAEFYLPPSLPPCRWIPAALWDRSEPSPCHLMGYSNNVSFLPISYHNR